MITRFLVCLCIAAASTAADAHSDAPLFSSDEVMHLTIPLDFKTLCRPRETPDCDYTPTVLEYQDGQGQTQSIAIEIKIRGGWRSLEKNCSAPLLFVRFAEQENTGTPFEGQSKLPLTTHCGHGISLESAQVRQNRTTWEQYLLKEYLAHRLYNEITDISLNSRLVRMTYPNPNKPRRKIVHYAFFTEHFESVAARNNDELLERGSFDHEKLDSRAADVVALFQFMIGNTDWSIVRERNIALLQDSGGAQLPLPFDFDMSGLVNAHYAGPAPGLSIDQVTERLFLGFCHPDTDWDALFNFFLGKEEALLAIIAEIPGLQKQSTRVANRFLERFFNILHSRERREEKIVSQCKPWPPSPVDHTTPAEKR
jgi:hypothetical protein